MFKSLVLLCVRLYIGVNLLYVAQQGGLAKYNSGSQHVADTVIKNLGPPFASQALFFAYCSIAAELCGSIGVILGFWSRLSGLLIACNFAVACYAHTQVWGQDLDSILYNDNNVHGAFIYLVAGLFIWAAGSGAFAVDSLLSGLCNSKDKED